MWWLIAGAQAGVWVREDEEAWLSASYVWLGSERMYDRSGAARPRTSFLGTLEGVFDEGAYQSHDLALYGEYGLGHGLEVDLSVPLRYARSSWQFAQGPLPPIVQQNLGPGDLATALRWGTKRGPGAFSTAARVRLPLYSNAPAALNTGPGNSDFFDDRVPLGAGTVDLDLTVSGGIGARFGWALVEAGGRVRSRGYSAELPGRIQLGLKPVEPLALWVGADGVLSLLNGAASDRFVDEWGKGPVAIDGQSALTATVGALLEVGEGYAPIVTVSRVVTAVRYPSATSFSVGLSRNFEVRR